MSDHATQSDSNKDEIPEERLQPYQSVWMSHWTHTRLRSVDGVRNQLSHCQEPVENSHRTKSHTLLSGPEIESGGPKFVKEVREIHKALENEDSTRSWKNFRTETFEAQLSPMIKSSQNREGNLSLKNGEPSSHQGGVSRSKIGLASGRDVSLGPNDKSLLSMLAETPSKPEIQSTESSFEPKGIASNPEQQVKSGKLLEKNRVVLSSPVRGELLGSTSAIVPLEFKSRRTPTVSFSPTQDYISRTSSNVLVHEGKIDKNASPLTHDRSTSDSQFREFLGEQFQKMPNYGLYPIGAPEASLYHGSYELPRNPSVHELSQTTHHVFITKGTDINLSGGGQMFRESITTKFKRESPSVTPEFSFNIKQGVKLQPLECSTESKGKGKIENVHSAVYFKHESSAATDTMDMDMLQENQFFDVAPSVANKDFNEQQNSATSEAAIASIKEESRVRFPKIELPDINQELRPIPSAASSTDDGDTSTSRTQSMDAEHFLSLAEHPTNLKSNACADGLLELDPCSRWVKRLRPSSSNSFAYGTKSSKMVEASSHKKVNKFFSTMLTCNSSSLESKMNKSFGIANVLTDQTADLPGNVESSSTGSVRESQEKTFSHAWIQRWCHNPLVSLQKKPDAVAACEPHSSRARQDNFEKKQFPSIAAMALMGKAMSGFHPCEFRKRGSFVVWNTKGLR